MVVKVYISGLSGNKEVKKRQQRVLLILDSKNIKYELIDIAEPNMEEQKEYMQNTSKEMGATIGDPNPRHQLPPQLYNDDIYCGDYDSFDMANEVDELEKFLKLASSDTPASENKENIGNGEVIKEKSPEKLETDDEKLQNTTEKSEEPSNDEKGEPEEGSGDKNETDDQKIENGSKEDSEEVLKEDLEEAVKEDPEEVTRESEEDVEVA